MVSQCEENIIAQCEENNKAETEPMIVTLSLISLYYIRSKHYSYYSLTLLMYVIYLLRKNQDNKQLF